MTNVPQGKCWHCGMATHQGQCPRIKAIEFYADGIVRRVEYHEPPGALGTFDPMPFVPVSDDEAKKLAEAMAGKSGRLVTQPRG